MESGDVLKCCRLLQMYSFGFRDAWSWLRSLSSRRHLDFPTIAKVQEGYLRRMDAGISTEQ